MSNLLPKSRREASLDAQSASLVENIRSSLTIQAEMFGRIVDNAANPVLLAELLEDTANRYFDFSERITEAGKGRYDRSKPKGVTTGRK